MASGSTTSGGVEELAVGYGSTGSPHGPLIGPEYGFGMTVGAANDAPIYCW